MANQDHIKENKEIELSIIIVNYNTRELLRQCLKSIYEFELNLQYEVIVIDNASSDGSNLLVKKEFPPVKLIENKKNLGFSKANNMGAKASQGQYILFLNPDIVVLEDSLEKMINFIKSHPDVGIIGPKLFYPDGSLQLSCRKFYTLGTVLARRTPLSKIFPFNKSVRNHLMADWDHASVRKVDWILAACLMIRRDLLYKIGYFDEKYSMYFEDVDLCFRIKQQGYKTYYIPHPKIIHYHQRESAGGFSSKTILHIKSMIRFYRKHWLQLLKNKFNA